MQAFDELSVEHLQLMGIRSAQKTHYRPLVHMLLQRGHAGIHPRNPFFQFCVQMKVYRIPIDCLPAIYPCLGELAHPFHPAGAKVGFRALGFPNAYLQGVFHFKRRLPSQVDVVKLGMQFHQIGTGLLQFLLQLFDALLFAGQGHDSPSKMSSLLDETLPLPAFWRGAPMVQSRLCHSCCKPRQDYAAERSPPKSSTNSTIAIDV